MAQMRALFDIPATVHGPSAARQLVTAVLSAWRLADLRADAILIVSELVTNAYQHAPGTDSFELELVRRDHGVRIWLADNSAVMPVIGELIGPEPRGRGMHIVAALATAWGAEAHHGGKRVWVDLDQEPTPP
jgi:anti-sigma regulatory factor (Ser/Thr protein kinase)